MYRSWFNLAMLAAESQQVISLRLVKLGKAGPRARREARRMVSEKIAAASQAAGRLMRGASTDDIVNDYRRKVRANRRRLSK
jgi:hypothetical protein